MRWFRALLKNASLAGAPKYIEHFSKFSPSPLSMKQFLDFGSSNACEKTSFTFLRQELPVRLANIMKEINLLPDRVLSTPSVQLVQSWYVQSLLDIMEFLDKDPEDHRTLSQFTDALVTIRNRHNDVVPTMAQGVLEYKDTYGDDPVSNQNIQYFLDRFYLSRISIRMLINQHTLIFDGSTNPAHPKHIGSIDPNCSVSDVVKDAYDMAKLLCDKYYMASPDLEIQEVNATNATQPIHMVYVPSHLYHMLFELFKNAMRATVESHESSLTLPPIKIMVALGEEDLSIKMSDRGGGVPLRKIERLFSYMYSTAPTPQPGTGGTPLAGFGYGLPISRLYAKYFQGDLQLFSMEGFGTDAVIYLKALSTDSVERLPVYNKSAWRHYQTIQEAGDWCVPSTEPKNTSTYRVS
ncbi:pyruvate dehydrogenase kinase, isozyme 2 [Rattus norvegicus]|uniref:[Pyruvate dehydrogenase (acetyl-transferring)] kinase isozyme 2, mitochondrial n=3 Tax=cellular organisms TaxID=131567 RepID=PDK2_RAT|nr:pyruvate dehydrogenase kinase, isozyme 2 [Rattus norvegicus]XP_032769051.1 pyruvate dehydrogenase kinase, isozyme 2 isoform X1 [Rattus rattus]Q64536.1 RecName: Full=[Pyruvate dehydrogenase (acetyl-transferring)] kinase isozyme 2, mitochondrial; AltName: Full=PDK P45; AltName: Full=Pyruvate dehydrogenase kinase isoform 2; Short=PDH kinase 2; Flags: Precursor [Rattus norvegicus]1JM6_A Chain A, Pyruvate dehydrogenase kinase, isozyme 2 [Rattus norvegicus]1JM6_B Chain B, Pyruvate dehydrogenase ki|eukprot:NP_110499.1 pyruvate dehydrogenase kinase, isozyme 2 [Rattus norvegicus]